MTRTLFLGSLVIAAFAIAACSGATEDDLQGAPAPTSTSDPTEPPPTPGKDGGSATPGPDAGGTPSSDAGSDSGPKPKPKDAFDGAPAYAAKVGPTTRQAGHSFANATPKTNPAGRPCLNCHGASGGAPTFAAAGTVFQGTKPASSVEVRIVDADGVAYSAYTDADGNYFFKNVASPIAFPAMAGVRNATSTKLMTGTAAMGNCNDCHSTAGGAGRIVVGP